MTRLAAITLVAWLLGNIVASYAFADDQSAITFSSAQWLYSDSETPPAFNDTDPVSLPHHWDRPGVYGSGWYQLEFPADLSRSKNTWSVFLPQVIMNAQVWLNGHMIGTGGSFEPPIARYWHTPLMFNFPTTILQAENTLQIRVVAYTNQHALLGAVVVGTEMEVKNLYRVQYFKTVTLSVVSGIFNALVAMFTFIIWYKRRESDYFWFAMSSLMWSIYSVNIFIVTIPVSEEYWEKFIFLSSGWLAISIAFLLVRIDKKNYPQTEKYILRICAIFSAVIIVAPVSSMFIVFSIWLQFSFIVGCIGVAHFAMGWWVHKGKESSFILAMLLGIAGAGLHDVLVQSGWVNQNDGLLLDYTLPLFFLMMSYLFGSRFLMALEEKEQLNSELENRVIAAGDLLEKNYRELLLLEKQQATTRERERIHRDLHDSIGAKILSLVYRSTNKADAELARSALSDLRNLVHQAPVSEQLLLEAIFEWEASCVNRCIEGGKIAHFHVHHVPKSIRLSKNQIHNLNALISEALTNALKHGRSKNIEISIRYRLGALKFEVVEYGHFDSTAKWEEGFGMKNMRYRIDQLKGKINWNLSSSANRVRWIIPIKEESHV